VKSQLLTFPLVWEQTSLKVWEHPKEFLSLHQHSRSIPSHTSLVDRDSGVIRCVGPDLHCGMVHLGKTPMDSLDTVQVSLS